jgi:hypothetical protein
MREAALMPLRTAVSWQSQPFVHDPAKRSPEVLRAWLDERAETGRISSV